MSKDFATRSSSYHTRDWGLFLRIIRSVGVLSETLFGLSHKLIGIVFVLDLTCRRILGHGTGIVAQVDRGYFCTWLDASEDFTIPYSDC